MSTRHCLEEKTVCKLDGLDQDFVVWHNLCATLPNGTVRGLFMLWRKDQSEIVSKLALFNYRPEIAAWSWKRDLPVTKAEQKAIAHVYKSCFLEEPGQILCSACDRQGRYFLYEKLL